MTQMVIRVPRYPSIEEIVRYHFGDHPQVETAVQQLVQRESIMADTMRTLGMAFGLHPEIVAEVLTNMVPLGEPVSDEARALIHTNYLRHLEELRRQFGDE